MKRYALVLSYALVLVPLVAGLAWPQAIQVREFDNIDYSGQSVLTHDGCLLITWKENFGGRLEQFFQLYDDQNNPLWPENLHIYLPFGFYKIVGTSDSDFVMVFFNMSVKAIKISHEGSLPWGEEGVDIFFRATDGLSVAADLNGGVYLAWAGSSGQNNLRKPSISDFVFRGRPRVGELEGWPRSQSKLFYRHQTAVPCPRTAFKPG